MKRAVCRIILDWKLAAERPIPRWLERACARDPQLAAELAAGRRLTESLRRDPRERRPERQPGLAGRVLGEVAAAEARRPERARAASALAWIGAAACAALLAVVAARFDDAAPRGSDGPSVATAEQPPASESAERERAPGVAASPKETLVVLDAIGRDWTNPLDREIEHVIADARSALDFLKSSFVPSGYLEGRDA